MVDMETRTFRQPATQGHRSRQEDVERSNRKKREADGPREVHFKGYSKRCQLARDSQGMKHVGYSLEASRTSGDSSATIIVGDAIRGAAWVASHAAVP